MESSKPEQFKEKIINAWDRFIKQSDEETVGEMGQERMVVFTVSLILALCLWLMVNLSRDYNLNIQLPISLGAVPEDRALAEDLPETATVSVMGQGWQLINIYNNPPLINIDVSDDEVNLYAQVQQQMNSININVQKVQPLILSLDLEERVTKKVPVRPIVKVSFEDQYYFTEPPSIQPDSITISGAASLLRDIHSWPTDSVHFTDISQSFSRPVELKDRSELISLSQSQVIYNATVAQFTEGETEVKITGRNLPEGRHVNFSPASINIKYIVPVMEFQQVDDKQLFEAFVSYNQILQDSTGFVTPQIEQVSSDEYHIKISSFKPSRVAYFVVLD